MVLYFFGSVKYWFDLRRGGWFPAPFFYDKSRPCEAARFVC